MTGRGCGNSLETAARRWPKAAARGRPRPFTTASEVAPGLGGKPEGAGQPSNSQALFSDHWIPNPRDVDAARPHVRSRSRASLQQRLFKTGGRLIRHARYFILQLAESHLTPTLFRQILGRIERLAWHPT